MTQMNETETETEKQTYGYQGEREGDKLGIY